MIMKIEIPHHLPYLSLSTGTDEPDQTAKTWIRHHRTCHLMQQFIYFIDTTDSRVDMYVQISEHELIYLSVSLREHAYSNILKILLPKNESFQMKNSKILYISAQNIDCGYSLEPPRRGSSNEYPQSMS